jgi:cell division control protein 6
MSFREIIRSGLRKSSSVFKDESILSVDYVPLELPHRQDTIQELTRLFKGIIENSGRVRRTALIIGPSGVGKTAVTKGFGEQICAIAKDRSINLHYIHVNCRHTKTPYITLNRIIQHFKCNFPRRGFGMDEEYIILNEILKREDAYVLLCLDDADQLLTTNPTLLYDLTRTTDEGFNVEQRVSLIIIASDGAFRRNLDRSTRSTFQPTVMRLAGYSSGELRDILESRIKDAFFEGTVLRGAIELIASYASEEGDARYAFELLVLAGHFAERDSSIQITPELVREAKENFSPKINREAIGFLTLHQLLLLLAIAQNINSVGTYTIMGDCESKYQDLCNFYGVRALSHTTIFALIKDLSENTKLIESHVGSLQDRAGQTTCIRMDVPVKVLTRIVESEIVRLISDPASKDKERGW